MIDLLQFPTPRSKPNPIKSYTIKTKFNVIFFFNFLITNLTMKKFTILFLIYFLLNSCSAEENRNVVLDEVVEASIEDTQPKPVNSLTIIGVGDIMLGTNFPSDKHLPPKGKNLFLPLFDVLASANVRFGNLEGAVADSGGTPKTCSDSSICYAFRQPEYLMDDLKSAGFNLLSIANNHIYDFGQDVLDNTVRVLDAKGFRFAGINSRPWDTLTVNGIKVGFCAFAPNPGTISIIDYEGARKIIQHLDSISDIVVVSFHGGAEGSKHRNITRDYEEFYEENRGNVYEFAHSVIDFGADVVFGHGPHVIRAVEVYKDRFIAYSLGNFCTYDRFNISGLGGIAPVIKLTVSKTGEFQLGEVISIKQKGRGGPSIDSTNAAWKEIIKLTNEDLPENNLKFEGNKIKVK